MATAARKFRTVAVEIPLAYSEARIEGNFLVIRIPLGDLPPEVKPRMMNPSTDTLHPRARETLSLLAQGLSNKELSDKMGIAVRTVKFHVSNLLAHFKVSTRHQLVEKVSKQADSLDPINIRRQQ